MSNYTLETRGLTKLFPGVIALNKVDMQFCRGEVHGIVGENGAGKSTLIMTLDGQYQPDAGDILLDGEKVVFKSAQDANARGISVVFQELSLVPTLSIAENIFANNQPRTRAGLVNWKKLWKDGRDMLALFQLDMDPHTPLYALSTANQQLIEILKAVATNPRVLILDEPTSSLTEVETAKLFELIRRLKGEGCTVIYISHHLQEIFTICDTVTVLKDGGHVCDARVADIDERFLISKMVGREVNNIYGERGANATVATEPVLRVEKLSSEGNFFDVSFALYPGQITTLTGLVGAGRTEVCKSIFGLLPLASGKIYLDGEPVNIHSPSEAMARGISYMTEDRKNEGLFLHDSIEFNLMANRLKQISRRGFVHDVDNKAASDAIIKKYAVSCTGRTQITETLSGGNQQKVLLAEWVEILPRVLMVDEPTRGIDVGAKSEIYRILHELADAGMAILVVSSELPETLNISDRILVMKSGTIAGEIPAAAATEESVMLLAAGSK